MAFRVQLGGGFGYGGRRRGPVNGETLLRRVKPNIVRLYHRYMVLGIISGVGIAGSVAMFMGGGMAGMGNFDAGSFGFSPLVYVGFAGIAICSMLMSLFFTLAYHKKILKDLLMEIKGHEKVSIENLSLQHVGRGSLLLIIKKLISTGNLHGYEVVGEVGVARTDIGARVSDFMVGGRVAAAPQSSRPKKNKCDSCGANVTESTGDFCKFCGTRLV